MEQKWRITRSETLRKDHWVHTKPDRLARSTAELLKIAADLSKRGIGLVVLSMGGERLDTRKPTSKLMPIGTDDRAEASDRSRAPMTEAGGYLAGPGKPYSSP